VTFPRVIWIVLDSVGIGAMPDFADYGDPPASDTLGNIARRRPLHIPNFVSLGLANAKPLAGISAPSNPSAAYGRCALRSPGKDTTTGHWEMVGVILDRPFPLFPNGFPSDFMRAFEDRIGRGTLWNKPASGTEIIRLLGDEHVRTGSPIVYTSADSVFQIAAHEEVIPLWELYKICETAREMLRGDLEVGRVIARPFEGESGAYRRTANRKDYAVPPPKGMLLDQLERAGVTVHSVGKIFDIFLGRGIGPHVKTSSNADGMAKTLAAMEETREGLIFVNLVDFDSLYGHRNDVEGYARALDEVDAWIPALLEKRRDGDLILFTADHGCDPTTESTDHSREYVPLLVHGGRPVDLGTRASLADIGQTVAQNFGCAIHAGVSFLGDIRN
jgi:phosphopentomutase